MTDIPYTRHPYRGSGIQFGSSVLFRFRLCNLGAFERSLDRQVGKVRRHCTLTFEARGQGPLLVGYFQLRRFFSGGRKKEKGGKGINALDLDSDGS